MNSKLITVTEVRISPDFKHAKVFYTFDRTKKDLFLEELISSLVKLNSKYQDWTAKFLPNLKFIFDESFDYAEKNRKFD